MKKERDEAKKQLFALKQAQAPMLRKIQLIDNQLKPTEAQIKAKVKRSMLQLGLKEEIRAMSFFFIVDMYKTFLSACLALMISVYLCT